MQGANPCLLLIANHVNKILFMAQLTKVDNKNLVQSKAFKEKMEKIMGEKTPQFVASVLSLITETKGLESVDQASLMSACISAASMDLPLSKNLGLAYAIPYKGKAQFQIGYKGFIQLGIRSGQFQTLSAAAIREGQIVTKDPLKGFEFDFDVEGGEIIGYAGYFKLINGFEKTLYMSVEDLTEHAKSYSETFKKGYGVWKDNFDAMAKKTVLKLILDKYAPKSLEMQDAVIKDQSVEEDKITYPDNGDVIEVDPDYTATKKLIEKSESMDDLASSIEYVEANKDLYPELEEMYNLKYEKFNKE